MKCGKHIALIVEDEPEMAAEVGDLLASIGHGYRHAATQVEAAQLVEKGGFCYVLLDLQIKRDADSIQARVEAGQHLLELIRKRYPRRNDCDHHHLPIIVMSGHAKETEYVVKALQDGADDFAKKPLSENKQSLPAKIQEQLRRSCRDDHAHCDSLTGLALASASNLSPLRIGISGRADGKRNVVQLDGAEVALTSSSFAILLQLAVGAARAKDGWIHKNELGARAEQGWKGISRLKEELRSRREVVENDGSGQYRLRRPVALEHIEFDALAEHSEARVRKLGVELQQLVKPAEPPSRRSRRS